MKLACAALSAVLACDGGKTTSGAGAPSAGSASTPVPASDASATGSGYEPPVTMIAKSEITIDGTVIGELRDPSLLAHGRIPNTTSQLITGVLDSWSSTHATLQLWTRTPASATWIASGAAFDAVIGRSGAAWGIGLHGDNFAPAKREGDGKSPAGVFTLRGSYGYAKTPPAGTKLPYTTSDTLECVDDPASTHYTQIVDGKTAARDWSSSERMRGNHHFYEWVIDIAHNAGATPKRGSCIFFHVWSGTDSNTEGCTAMNETALVELMKRLDPAANPIYVLLPRAEYTALAPIWALPPLP